MEWIFEGCCGRCEAVALFRDGTTRLRFAGSDVLSIDVLKRDLILVITSFLMEGNTMPRTKTKANLSKGLDTLKVLSMRIAPGQELEALVFEGKAKKIWYGDGYDGGPYIVFVKGSRVPECFRAIIRDPYCRFGDDVCVWGFEERQDAERFVRIVHFCENISYWLTGLSRQYAMAAEYPLIGYSSGTMDYPTDLTKGAALTERMRVLAHELLELYRGRFNMSVVMWMYPSTLEQVVRKCDPAAVENGKRETRDGKVFYSVFRDLEAAHRYFAWNVGMGTWRCWHFALSNY